MIEGVPTAAEQPPGGNEGRAAGETPMTEPDAMMISIGTLSRACGIPVETLRTWERRYGFPHPVRKPSGHRLYPVAGISRIRRIAEAVVRGHRIGDVIHASEEALDRLLAATGAPEDRLRSGSDTPPATTDAETTGPPRHHLDEEVAEALRAVEALDSESLTRQLLSALARLGPITYLSEFVGPLLHRVGRAWAEGRIEIRHEHALSERLRDVMRTIRLPLEERAHGPRVVLATLPGEEHSLGLDMAALVFAHSGWRTLYLGSQVPVPEIAASAAHSRARAVGISVSEHANSRETEAALRELRLLLPSATTLLVGGEGALRGVEGVRSAPELESMQNLGALERWAGEILAREWNRPATIS